MVQPGLLLFKHTLLLLQDSTRYQKTQALLEKYDPEYVPPSPRGAGQMSHAFASPEPRKRLAELLARSAVAVLIAGTQEQACGQAGTFLAGHLQAPAVLSLLLPAHKPKPPMHAYVCCPGL